LPLWVRRLCTPGPTGELTPLPRLPSWIKGKGHAKGKEGRGLKERKERPEEKEGKGVPLQY